MTEQFECLMLGRLAMQKCENTNFDFALLNKIVMSKINVESFFHLEFTSIPGSPCMVVSVVSLYSMKVVACSQISFYNVGYIFFRDGLVGPESRYQEHFSEIP